jgi:hypothetical protein
VCGGRARAGGEKGGAKAVPKRGGGGVEGAERETRRVRKGGRCGQQRCLEYLMPIVALRWAGEKVEGEGELGGGTSRVCLVADGCCFAFTCVH